MFHYIKLVLIAAVLYYGYMFHEMIMIKSLLLKTSYLKSIETKGIDPAKVKELLLAWGLYSVGDNIVPTKGHRPIYIKDMYINGSFYKAHRRYVRGVAFVYPTSCRIYINPDIYGKPGVARTILHEYLHCLGYSHVDNPFDLMYTSSGNSTLKSVQGYGIDVYRRRLKW